MKSNERRIVFQSLIFLSATILVLLVLSAAQERRVARLETQMQVKQQSVKVENLKVEVVTPVQYRTGLPTFAEGKR